MRNNALRFVVPVAFLTFCFGVECPAQQNDENRGVQLLFVSDVADDSPEALENAERRTIQSYKAVGTEVFSQTEADLEDWLAGDGRHLANAMREIQLIGFARANNADAIGGIGQIDVIRGPFEQSGLHFYGWIINLKACTRTTSFTHFIGTPESHVPLWDDSQLCIYSMNEQVELVDQEWAEAQDRRYRRFLMPLTLSIPKSPPTSRLQNREHAVDEERAFIGVSLFENLEVADFLPATSAEDSGIQVKDRIVGVNGVAVDSASSIADVIAGRREGDEIEIQWERDGETQSGFVRLTSAKRVDEARRKQFMATMSKMLSGNDIHGQPFRLEDHTGDVIAIHFWSPSSELSKNLIPDFQLLAEAMGDKGFIWVNVAQDVDEGRWRTFVEDNDLKGVQLFQGYSKAYGRVAIAAPHTLYFDRKGRVSYGLLNEPPAAIVAKLIDDAP